MDTQDNTICKNHALGLGLQSFIGVTLLVPLHQHIFLSPTFFRILFVVAQTTILLT